MQAWYWPVTSNDGLVICGDRCMLVQKGVLIYEAIIDLPPAIAWAILEAVPGHQRTEHDDEPT